MQMEQRGKDRREKEINIFIDRRVRPRRSGDVPYTMKMSPILRRKRTHIFTGVITLFLLLNVLDLFLTGRGISMGALESSTIILTMPGFSFTQTAIFKFLLAIIGAIILFNFRYLWSAFVIALFVTLFYPLLIVYRLLFL